MRPSRNALSSRTGIVKLGRTRDAGAQKTKISKTQETPTDGDSRSEKGAQRREEKLG